jgi:hypothetical protein
LPRTPARTPDADHNHLSSTTAQPRIDLPEAVRLTDLAMNACNLSGLAHEFPRVMEAAWDDVRTRGGGTDQANHHPLAVLWLIKMTELAGLCVTAADTGARGADGIWLGDAIQRAFNWLREHSRHISAAS